MAPRVLAENVDWPKMAVYGAGAFVAISFLAYMSLDLGYALIMASFGASSVILFVYPGSAAARPRCVFFGHLIAAVAGVALVTVLGLHWYTCGLAVFASMMAMVATDTVHPPGGATALIAVLGAESWGFILMPVALGALVMVAVAHGTGWTYRRLAHPERA